MYYRVTYNDIGVYEALKKQIWNDNNDFTKKDWENFKKSDEVNWLKIPNVYKDNNCSFFTELGFEVFMNKTYPLIIQWLDKENIKIENCNFDIEKVNLIYSDEHQIVIEKLERIVEGTKLLED